ncbi:MAG TPA: hypothetical protein PLO65_05100 [Caulobacter sp.]|nr:hypothetical protein [Caulobacter sp.]
MNLRHAVRVNIRLNLDVIRATRAALGGDLERSLIFAAISAANVAILEDDPALSLQLAHTSVPDPLRRPIRVQRIAESLGLPRETTRVKVRQLLAEGLLEETPAGLLMSADTARSPRFEPMFGDYIAALARAIERLAAGGCVGLTASDRLAGPPLPATWGAIRLVTQHILRGVVELRASVGPTSLIKAYLYLAMADGTAGHFSQGEVLRHADFDDPPPPAARRTISASSLALSLDLPRETVRRNLQALAREGYLFQRSGGFGIPTPVSAPDLQREREVYQRSMADLSRLVRRLRQIDAITGQGAVIPSPAP